MDCLNTKEVRRSSLRRDINRIVGLVAYAVIMLGRKCGLRRYSAAGLGYAGGLRAKLDSDSQADALTTEERPHRRSARTTGTVGARCCQPRSVVFAPLAVASPNATAVAMFAGR